MTLGQARTLASTAHLIFGVESARSAGNLVLAPMTAHLTEQGRLSWQQALSPRLSPDLHLPMARAGAPAAARGLEHRISGQTGIPPRHGGLGSLDAVNAMARSEEQIVIAYVETVAGREMAAQSEESIRRAVRQFVRDYYRLPSASRLR